MKTQKLIPLLDYVLEVINSDIPCNRGKMLDDIGNYAKFLSQPLKLSMFVPCDSNGNLLEEPRMEFYDSMTGWNFLEDARNYQDKLEAYNKSKSNVLFEGFEVTYKGIMLITLEIDVFSISFHENTAEDTYKTIEDLSKYGLTLTENAVKTING